ncbi:MAG: undecaprenyl-diphosphatase UppP [Candidatus Microgenomates bacterium]
MDLLNAIILGVVEGLTEFLPISSTAHLILIGKLLKIPQSDFVSFFDIVIQSGAILAVIFLYFNYILKNKKLWLKIIVSFLPTAVVGLILEKIIKKYFFNSFYLIIGAMFFIGLLFIVFEVFLKRKKLDKNILEMSYLQAFFIGLGQSLAVVPGVSRAGAVILTMMILGFRRDESAIYSFLLAVPTILAASGLEIIKSDWKIIFANNNLSLLIIGFITSFIVALIVVQWFIDFLKKKSLIFFGIYRIVVAFLFLWYN